MPEGQQVVAFSFKAAAGGVQERPAAKKRWIMNRAGMRPSPEDLRWLRLIAGESNAAIPDFNKSRLVAMSLAERRNDALQITEKGKALITGGPGT